MELSIKAVDLIHHTFSRADIGVPMSHADQVEPIRQWAQAILEPHIKAAQTPPTPAPPSVTRPKRIK